MPSDASTETDSAAPENGARPVPPPVNEKLCNLPRLKPVATKILQISSSDDAAAAKLIAAFKTDPAFGVEVLHLANSPLFGFHSTVRSIEHAVSLLGLERSKSLACTVAMREYLTSENNGPVLRQCWNHSLVCAAIAEEIVPLCGGKKDDAYTAGLMHDMGRFGLLKAYPDKYGAALTRAFQTVEESLEAERAAVGINHCEAGHLLGSTWSFPPELCEIARIHHAKPDHFDRGRTYVIQIACLLADLVGFAAVDCENRISYEELTSQFRGELGARFRLSVRQLQDRVLERVHSLQS